MTKFMVVCDSYKQCLSLCIPSHPQLIPVSPRPTLPPRSRVCSVGDGPRDHDERAELDERHRPMRRNAGVHPSRRRRSCSYPALPRSAARKATPGNTYTMQLAHTALVRPTTTCSRVAAHALRAARGTRTVCAAIHLAEPKRFKNPEPRRLESCAAAVEEPDASSQIAVAGATSP